MISRVRAVYDPAYAGFDGEGKSVEGPASLKGLVKEGYIELVGVINPRSVGEIYYVPLPPTPKPKLEQEAPKAETEQETDPILYEYFWSAGMTGFDPKWYERLDDDDPIVVQLIFHTKDSRYSTQEVAANLKQVPPFQKTTEKKIREWFEQLQPVAATAGQVMGLAGATVPGKIIAAIAQMKLNTVLLDDFPWWVKTFSFEEEAGIEWHIPRRLIQYVGNRLVGSLGTYFIECDTSDPTLKNEISIEMRTFLRSPRREELYISPTNKKTELVLRPNAPELRS
jgi:hypothetical protein